MPAKTDAVDGYKLAHARTVNRFVYADLFASRAVYGGALVLDFATRQ